MKTSTRYALAFVASALVFSPIFLGHESPTRIPENPSTQDTIARASQLRTYVQDQSALYDSRMALLQNGTILEDDAAGFHLERVSGSAGTYPFEYGYTPNDTPLFDDFLPVYDVEDPGYFRFVRWSRLFENSVIGLVQKIADPANPGRWQVQIDFSGSDGLGVLSALVGLDPGIATAQSFQADWAHVQRNAGDMITDMSAVLVFDGAAVGSFSVRDIVARNAPGVPVVVARNLDEARADELVLRLSN